MGRGIHSLKEDLIEKAYTILEEIHPASVRAVCYRLFTSGAIDSMEKKNTQKVSRALVYGRENGLIPWEWIVDETRSIERSPTWSDKEEFAIAASEQFRRDYWDYQPCRIEVWSEKGTVRGTLAPVLKKYAVGFQVMHGFGSATAVKMAADASNNDEKRRVVLYVGDYDCSGLHMSAVDLPERIERYGGNIELTRLALTEFDVNHRGLPSFPASDKSKDPRFKWFVKKYGTLCWELDALSPVILRQTVELAIDSAINQDAWDRCARAEKAEQETLKIVMRNWAAMKEVDVD